MSKSAATLLFLVAILSVASANECEGALAKLLPNLVQLLTDASSGNVEQFDRDLQAAAPAIEAAGQACTGLTPSSQCESELESLTPYTNAIVTDLADGNTEQLEQDVAAAAPSLNTAIYGCTGFQVTAQCSTDLLGLIQPGAQVVDDLRSNNLADLTADLESFLPYAKLALADCTGTQVTDTCQSSIDLLVPSITAVITDLTSNNYLRLLSDALKAFGQLQVVVQDCLGHDVSQQCQGDIFALLPVAMQVYQDVQNDNWEQAERDLAAAQGSINQALEDCIGGDVRVSETAECDQYLAQLVPPVTKIYEYFRLNETSSLITEVESIKTTMEWATHECSTSL